MKLPYVALRNAHLGAALAASAFLAAYAASAVQMAYFRARPEPERSSLELEVPAVIGDEPRAVARWLMVEHGVRGVLTEVDARRGGEVRLRLERPGTSHRVAFDPATRRARVATQRWSAVWALNRLHHAAGLAHGYRPLDLWGAAVLLASIALLTLAASGVALWFRRHRERRAGAVVFAAGLVWGVGLLVWIRLL
jgi:hypothetical protein